MIVDAPAEIEAARKAVRENPDMIGVGEDDPHFHSMVTLELACRLSTARWNIKLATGGMSDEGYMGHLKRQLHSHMRE